MGRSPLVPGEDPLRIDGYWLAGRLGVGGQAVVYEAYDQAGRRVAVKALRGGGFGPGAQREVEAASRVPPFFTARVLAAEIVGPRPYIVSEFVDGPSLQEEVAERGPLAGHAVYRLAVGIITAVATIHQAGVVHRDIKPANVLLGPDGPRVIDFGIARILAESATASHGVAGTPRYMAPEQVNRERAEQPADIHAWAAIVLYAATGRHPFDGGSNGEIANAVLRTTPDLSDVPPILRSRVAAALAKDPDDRPTAVRLLTALIGTDLSATARFAPGDHGYGVGSSEVVNCLRSAGSAGVTTDDHHLAVLVPQAEVLLRSGMGAEQSRARIDGSPSRHLGQVAEELYEARTSEQRQLLVQVLLRMLEPEPGGGMAPRALSVRELPFDGDSPDLGVVVDRLVEAELATRSGDWLSLGSAALAYAWPRLREWLADEGDGLRLLARIHADARFWREHGKREEDLLQGSLLEQATSWAATGRTRVVLNELERGYLNASRHLLARRERRRRTVTALLAGMVAVLLLAGGGLIALNRIASAARERADEQRDTANEQRDIALSRQLAARSQTIAVRAPSCRDSLRRRHGVSTQPRRPEPA